MSLLLRSSPWLTSTTLEYPYLIAGREIGPPTTDFDRRPYHQERAVLTASLSPTAPIQLIETDEHRAGPGAFCRREAFLSPLRDHTGCDRSPSVDRPGGKKKGRGAP
jgi:hypothetical protein